MLHAVKLFLTGTPLTMAVTVPGCPESFVAFITADVPFDEVTLYADEGATLHEEAEPEDKV
jgi:hypothetical protein